MPTYETFKRSARNWEEFASAERITVGTGLTYLQARKACREFNSNLSERDIELGTKLEFTSE